MARASPRSAPVQPEMDDGFPPAGEPAGELARDAEMGEARHDVKAIKMVLKCYTHLPAPDFPASRENRIKT